VGTLLYSTTEQTLSFINHFVGICGLVACACLPPLEPRWFTHDPTYRGKRCRLDLPALPSAVLASSRAHSFHRKRWRAPGYHKLSVCCAAPIRGPRVT
jgi:hypothetical protein